MHLMMIEIAKLTATATINPKTTDDDVLGAKEPPGSTSIYYDSPEANFFLP